MSVIYWLYLRHHARSVTQMNTIAIALSDERLLKLQKLANDLNVSIEELVLIGIENLLAQPESLSPNTAQNIINKNAEIPPDIVEKFYALASDWEKDVAGLSSTAQMSQHPRTFGKGTIAIHPRDYQTALSYWVMGFKSMS